MLNLTVQEVLESAERTQGHCIYAYRDGDTLFYIGRSLNPCERLRQHMGQGHFVSIPDAIGSLIIDNSPQSLLWTVEIWTLEELVPELYQDALAKGRLADLIDSLESDLITEMKPCLNTMYHNYINPLPSRYIKRKIANAGVKLG